MKFGAWKTTFPEYHNASITKSDIGPIKTSMLLQLHFSCRNTPENLHLSRTDKILQRIQNNPSTLAWRDVVYLFTNHLGYEELPAKGGGSCVRFFNPETTHIFLIHKPHPENEICGGALKSAISHLKEIGVLSDE